jgi:hypothetical protein
MSPCTVQDVDQLRTAIFILGMLMIGFFVLTFLFLSEVRKCLEAMLRLVSK